MIIQPTDRVRRLEHRGAVYRLRKELLAGPRTDDVLEYVIEGPRGTGKSNGTAYTLYRLAKKYPGSRHLVIRTERTLLTDTFCKTFEEDVCPGDPCLGNEKERGNRHEYYFPLEKSRIVLGGLDKADRYYGADWDTVTCEEAVKFPWKKVMPFFGSLRNNAMGFHAMFYPTNPEAPSNWVNQRAKKGLAKRMRCFLKDNPSLYDAVNRRWHPKGVAFLKTLARYTGVEKLRHVDGEWAGAEGLVWENYSPERHLFTLKNPAKWREELGIVECRMTADWGFRDTGVLIVWGIDNCKRMRALAWRYETKQHLNTWAANAVALAREFQVTSGRGDPSRPDAISLFNDMLSKAGHPRIFSKATNTRASLPNGDLAGIGLVRWSLELDDVGIPNLSFYEKGLRNTPDADLVEENKPWFGPDEIQEYVHARDADGEIAGDRTDAACRDDFCDAVRYGVTDNWGKTPRAPEPEPMVYARDTYAAKKGTAETRFKDKMQRERAQGEW